MLEFEFVGLLVVEVEQDDDHVAMHSIVKYILKQMRHIKLFFLYP